MIRLHIVIPLLAVLCFAWACGGGTSTDTGEGLAKLLEESVDKIVTVKGRVAMTILRDDGYRVYGFESLVKPKASGRFYVIAGADECQYQEEYEITGKVTIVPGKFEGTPVSVPGEVYMIESPEYIEQL